MHRAIHQGFGMIAMFLTVSILSGACKKTVENWIDKKADTVYDTISNLSANRILEYRVANVGEHTIYSSIDNDKRTITVYLPHYYALNYLETNIVLPQGATISPSQDELVPVFYTSPFEYKVKDAKNNTATYQVEIVVQQPGLSIQELSAAGNTRTYAPGATIEIKGKNLVPDFNITKICLLDSTGKKVYEGFTPTTNGRERSTTMIWRFGREDITNNPNLLANTDYWIEMQCYALQQKMQYPIRIRK